MSEDKVFEALLGINKNVGELHGKVDGMGIQIEDIKVCMAKPCKQEKRITDIETDVKSITKTVWKWSGSIAATGIIVTILIKLFWR